MTMRYPLMVGFMVLVFVVVPVTQLLGVTDDPLVLTYGLTNTVSPKKYLGLTGFRAGCSSAPSSCMAVMKKNVATEDLHRVFLAIGGSYRPLDVDALEYSRLSVDHPFLEEIGLDDFVSFCYHGYVDEHLNMAELLDKTIKNAKQHNPHLKFGLTLYENELSYTYLDDAHVSKSFKDKVDYVHLYLLYRKNAPAYASYVAAAKKMFRNAKIIAGIYAYDRIDYVACDPSDPRKHCTRDEEFQYFKTAMEVQYDLWKKGEVAGLEFYPAYFGHEDQWPGWNNAEFCKPGRIKECVANTHFLRQIVLDVFQQTQIRSVNSSESKKNRRNNRRSKCLMPICNLSEILVPYVKLGFSRVLIISV